MEGREVGYARARLARLIQTNNYHADAAPAVLHALLPVLTGARRLDLAYMVLLQTSAPSWLANLLEGEKLMVGEPSLGFDPAQIGLMEWLIDSLVGLTIAVDEADASQARHLIIKPQPPFGHQFLAGSPVSNVEARLPTSFGQIGVEWWIREAGFELRLEVPTSCTATVVTPDGIEQTVQSGQHHFMMDFDRGGDGIPTLLDLTSVG